MLERAGSYKAAASAYSAIAARERNGSLAARAAQAQVRALVQSGDTAGARLAIEKHFSAGRLRSGRDSLGRLIAADAYFLVLRLLAPADARRPAAVERLALLLNDYESITMPSTQRLFLMDELSTLAPSVALPTHAAERLAAEFLRSDGTRTSGCGLEPSSSRGVWKLGERESAVALFTTVRPSSSPWSACPNSAATMA